MSKSNKYEKAQQYHSHYWVTLTGVVVTFDLCIKVLKVNGRCLIVKRIKIKLGLEPITQGLEIETNRITKYSENLHVWTLP